MPPARRKNPLQQGPFPGKKPGHGLQELKTVVLRRAGGIAFPWREVPGRRFPAGRFPGGQFPGGKFPQGRFPGGKFPAGRPLRRRDGDPSGRLVKILRRGNRGQGEIGPQTPPFGRGEGKTQAGEGRVRAAAGRPPGRAQGADLLAPEQGFPVRRLRRRNDLAQSLIHRLSLQHVALEIVA
jgi:hypothetical protein